MFVAGKDIICLIKRMLLLENINFINGKVIEHKELEFGEQDQASKFDDHTGLVDIGAVLVVTHTCSAFKVGAFNNQERVRRDRGRERRDV